MKGVVYTVIMLINSSLLCYLSLSDFVEQTNKQLMLLSKIVWLTTCHTCGIVAVYANDPGTGILLSRAFPHSAHWWGFHWTIEVCLVNSKPSVGEPCLMMPSGWNADVFLKLRLTIWQTLRNTLIKTINEYNIKNMFQLILYKRGEKRK